MEPTTLRARIRSEIATDGAMPFSRYMELALYDREHGFFARTPPGPRGHFVTSPHLSPVFGDCIVRAVSRALTTLGDPDDFAVVDLGAGDGTLSRVFAANGLRTIAVERSEAARASLHADGVEPHATIPAIANGLVIANELFDNVPFDLRAQTGEEIRVTTDGDRLAFTGDATTARPALGDDAREMIDQTARALARGYVLIIDYADPDEPIRGYRDQRPVTDVLEAPGETDVTGPVDLDALAAFATEAGLQVQGHTSQRDLLARLGYREVLDAMKRQQHDARARGDSAAEVYLWNARGEASVLVDPAGLGGYGVLILATPGLPPLLPPSPKTDP